MYTIHKDGDLKVKKFLVLLMILGIVGCSSNGTEPEVTETPDVTVTPEPTEVVVEPIATPHPDSKINIELYKVDEYYPVVDGVVTYPDGTTEEFNNGFWGEDQGGSGEDKYYLFQNVISNEWIQGELQRQKDGTDEIYRYLEFVVLPDGFNFYLVKNERPEILYYSYSSKVENDVVDGVFGYDSISDNGSVYTEILLRYCTQIPKGYDINEAINIIAGSKSFYVWRIGDFDEDQSVVGVEDIKNNSGYVTFGSQFLSPDEWWGK